MHGNYDNLTNCTDEIEGFDIKQWCWGRSLER